MKIKFSRHAKRRAKLYNIPETIIIDILKQINLKKGKNEVIQQTDEFQYPLKIIAVLEENTINVVTNYPLKKVRNNNENLL